MQKQFQRVTLPISVIISLFITILLTGCLEENAPQGQLIISMGGKFDTSGGRAESDTQPDSVILTITSEGSPVMDRVKIGLIRFGELYMLDPILLDEGTYEISSFLVVNGDGDVIYATPISDSPYASLVDNPLPIAFTILSDEVTEVGLEVITAEGIRDPEQFGYGALFFELVPTYDLQVSVLEQIAGSTDFVEATLKVYVQDELVFEQALGDSINVVRIRRDYESVEFKITLTDDRTASTTIAQSDFSSFVDTPVEFTFRTPPLGLYALIGTSLALLNQETAEVQWSFELSNPPAGGTLRRPTFHSNENAFYLIKDHSTNPVLARISASGEYTEVGAISYNGSDLALTEGLAYDSQSGQLYLAASLNGGPDDGDFECESLLTLDPATAVATFVTEMSVSIVTQPEADMDEIAINAGRLVFLDAAPPGANFLKIFEISLDQLVVNGSSSPMEVYSTTYVAGVRLELSGDKIYTAIDKTLYETDRTNPMGLSSIGTTHTASEFDGESIGGLILVE